MRTLELVSRDVHELELGDASVRYVLLRKRGRRGVGLKVDGAGLTVSAPHSFPRAEIERLIRGSERWVVRKIAEWGTRRVPEPSWEQGAALPYLGGVLVLRTESAARARVELAAGELHVGLRAPGDHEAVRRAVVAWYKRAALEDFTPRTHALARSAGLAAPRIFLSSALRRWGSCNAAREIRLSWRLVKVRPQLIDYVVSHELAHVRHMNHARAFWAEVERLCPDYRRLREELHATDHLYRSF